MFTERRQRDHPVRHSIYTFCSACMPATNVQRSNIKTRRNVSTNHTGLIQAVKGLSWITSTFTVRTKFAISGHNFSRIVTLLHVWRRNCVRGNRCHESCHRERNEKRMGCKKWAVVKCGSSKKENMPEKRDQQILIFNEFWWTNFVLKRTSIQLKYTRSNDRIPPQQQQQQQKVNYLASSSSHTDGPWQLSSFIDCTPFSSSHFVGTQKPPHTHRHAAHTRILFSDWKKIACGNECFITSKPLYANDEEKRKTENIFFSNTSNGRRWRGRQRRWLGRRWRTEMWQEKGARRNKSKFS